MRNLKVGEASTVTEVDNTTNQIIRIGNRANLISDTIVFVPKRNGFSISAFDNNFIICLFKEQRRGVNTIKGRTDCAVISRNFFLTEYSDTVYIHTGHPQLRGLLQDALIGQIRMGIFAFNNDVDIS